MASYTYPESHKPSNYDMVNTRAIEENTPSDPPSFPPSSTTCVHYKKLTHVSTYYLHVALNNFILSNIITIAHNKIVWQIYKSLLSHSSTRNTFLMNVDTHLGSPSKNTILLWLYPCFCSTKPCQCLTRSRHDILVITTTSPKKTTHYTTQNLSL
jgi:hypothetical protein